MRFSHILTLAFLPSLYSALPQPEEAQQETPTFNAAADAIKNQMNEVAGIHTVIKEKLGIVTPHRDLIIRQATVFDAFDEIQDGILQKAELLKFLDHYNIRMNCMFSHLD
jgi:hypothetical protein